MLGTHSTSSSSYNLVSPKNEGGDASLFLVGSGSVALQLYLHKASLRNTLKQLDDGGVEPTFSTFGRCRATLKE